MLVRTAADEAARRTVDGRAFAHQPSDLHLAHAFGNTVQSIDAQRLRYFVEQRFEIRCANRGKHLLGVFVSVRYEGHGNPLA